jgi:hypothetical protein
VGAVVARRRDAVPHAPLIRTHLDDPLELASVWDAVTEAELTPWYRENLEEDRARIAEIEALRNGLELRSSKGKTNGKRIAR